MAKSSKRVISRLPPRGEMPEKYTKIVGKEDAALLEEIRENYDYDYQNWQSIRDEGDIDVRYIAGDTWDDEDATLRAGRPMLKFDQLNQHINRLTNTVIQNRRAIKVSQRGEGATDRTAEVLGNRIRDIEYESNAQHPYNTAFSNCANRSYGFARIVAEYEDEDSDNQVLRLKAIPNPNQVLPDSDAEIPTGKDWKRLNYVYDVSHGEFTREWPHAKIRSFGRDLMKAAPAWIRDTRVQISEYWYVREDKKKKGRPKRTVRMVKTNGVEILERHEWKGKYIPFAACLGKILYKTSDTGEAEKVIQSYIRLARHGAKAYNWVKSTEYEELSSIMKAAVHAYEGQITPEQMKLLENSTYQPTAAVLFKATLENLPPGTILPLPQRPQITLNTAAFEGASESARRDIQNALGQYSVPDRRQGPTKVVSGTALQELEKSGDLGTYHYINAYDQMLQFLGEQLVDLIPFYDDTPKTISTRHADGTMEMVQVNTPTARGPQGDPTFGANDVNLKQGKHVVTISTGPSFDSEREMARELATTLLGNPQAFPVIAADAVRLMNVGPIGDTMADDLESIQPPALQAAKAAKTGKVDPKQLLRQNAQLKQQLQEAHGIISKAQQEISSKQAELDNKLQIAQYKGGVDLHITEMVNEVKLGVAAIGAKVDQHALLIEESKLVGARMDALEQRLHEVGMAAADAGHEAHMADLQQASLQPPSQQVAAPDASAPAQ